MSQGSARRARVGLRQTFLGAIFALASLGASTSPAQAQAETVPTDLIDTLRARIRANYVDTMRVASVLAGLDSLRRAGRFERETIPVMLAAALTREVARLMDGDLHFRVMSPRFAARTAVGAGAGGAERPATTIYDTVRSVRAIASNSDRVQRERQDHHFFRRVDSLPGNVLVIALDGFAAPTAEAYARAAEVMGRAAAADAIIFDLRQNGGGVEGLNQFLASHLFPADPPLVLYERYVHSENRSTVYPVLRELSAPRSVTAPVYVITSRSTGSAAENFAYTLQQHRRAVVVGERTQGAGNSAQRFELPGGWAVTVPVAHVSHPVTKRGWNGSGVVPDVAMPPAAAVDSAYSLALRRLRETRTAPLRR